MEISNPEAWDKFKKDYGSDNEIIIFKYSPVCSFSRSIEKIYDSWISEMERDPRFVSVKVDVIGQRPLSGYISEDTGITHQSPQVIWLRNDLTVKWAASHSAITRAALNLGAAK